MRALLSVYDKTGLVPFAERLVELGFELVSTGGTHAALAAAGLPVIAVSDVTGFPEMLDGRVKTLHPRIHAGLLARLELEEHRSQLSDHGIEPISLVACNLYPFESTVAKPSVQLDEAVEQIDIGGPSMIRAAAKNFAHVITVVDPADYQLVLVDLRAGVVPADRLRALAAKAFGHVSTYDAIVADYLRNEEFPDELTIAGRKAFEPRYGENPHQRAAAYRLLGQSGDASGVLAANQLSGKAMSFNNLLDADAALGVVRGEDAPAVCVVKHMTPCGYAVCDDLAEATRLAIAGDPVSAFGGIVALNRVVDEAAAERLAAIFLEIVIAPGFSPSALALLSKKKQLRLLELPAMSDRPARTRQIRTIAGGFVIQEQDQSRDDPSAWRTVTQRQPTEPERRDAEFAWRAARFVKSNAIVIAKDQAVRGVGAGQPNRVESVRIAINRAGENAKGAALASDAFFPFADGPEAAISAGVTCIVQPGGSVRDDDVIKAADAAGVAMLFTGVRHFLH